MCIKYDLQKSCVKCQCYTSSFIQQILMSPYCGSGPFLDMVDGAKKKDIKIPVLKKKKKKKKSLPLWSSHPGEECKSILTAKIRLCQETSQASWSAISHSQLAWDDPSITCKVRAGLGWCLDISEKTENVLNCLHTPDVLILLPHLAHQTCGLHNKSTP